MEPVTAVLVGAGQRGRYVYGAYASEHPAELSFVGVVDPDDGRREAFGAIHNIPLDRRFAHHEEALSIDAEAWIIASPDRAHRPAALAALGTSIPALVEKPLAATIEDATALVDAGRRSPSLLMVAHVLRYTPFFQTLHEVLASGRLGEIMTVEHRENVVAWHMAHSFVRGNWSRSNESTPMVVAKCCHDFDILTWNLASPVRWLSSIGSLLHFRPENAPAGATTRCTAPCPVPDCPFDARRVYLNMDWSGWPVQVVTDDLSLAGRRRALENGPYGKCVYTARSDVVDQQIVTMELESGASVSLTMHGHAHEDARTMRYDGSRATLRAVFGRQPAIEVIDHVGGRAERIPIRIARGGHGGGDSGAVEAFIAAIRSGEPPPTTATESLESHYLAFAAEEARLNRSTIDMHEYRARFTT